MPTHMTLELATGWQGEKQLLINLAVPSELESRPEPCAPQLPLLLVTGGISVPLSQLP